VKRVFEKFKRTLDKVHPASLCDRSIQTDLKNKDIDSFLERLEVSKTLASEIVATFAIQKGAQSADSVDIFRADLDNYLVLAKAKGVKGADKEKIAERLSFLSQMAHEFAKKELQAQSKNEKRSIELSHEHLFAHP
jgi:hypothetical protein